MSSPLACSRQVLRAALRPPFGWVMTWKGNRGKSWAKASADPSVEPSMTTRTSIPSQSAGADRAWSSSAETSRTTPPYAGRRRLRS